jgi:NADH-quinone oxidoreductase subunit I
MNLSTILLSDLRKGLAVTIKHFFSKPFTIMYPEERRQIHKRFRGVHQLVLDDLHLPLCNACSMCARVCPTNAIKVTAAKEKIDGKRRVPEVFEIDLSRCMFCVYCEESCPQGAIVMGNDYETSALTREECMRNFEQLKVKK